MNGTKHDTDEINLIDLVASTRGVPGRRRLYGRVMLMHVLSGQCSLNQLLVMKLMVIGKHDKRRRR